MSLNQDYKLIKAKYESRARTDSIKTDSEADSNKLDISSQDFDKNIIRGECCSVPIRGDMSCWCPKGRDISVTL